MIDLDQNRIEREAARREANQRGPVVKLGGEECELAPEMPYEILEAFGDMVDEETAGAALAKVMPVLLGEHYPKFLALTPPPTVPDMEFLVENVMSAYGVENPLAS